MMRVYGNNGRQSVLYVPKNTLAMKGSVGKCYHFDPQNVSVFCLSGISDSKLQWKRPWNAGVDFVVVAQVRSCID
jgi:hypothetical protein